MWESELVHFKRQQLERGAVKELNSPSESCFFTGLFLLVNSLNVPTGSAGRGPAPCAAGSRKASVTSRRVRNGMRSSCPGSENVSLKSGVQHE